MFMTMIHLCIYWHRKKYHYTLILLCRYYCWSAPILREILLYQKYSTGEPMIQQCGFTNATKSRKHNYHTYEYCKYNWLGMLIKSASFLVVGWSYWIA